MSNSHNPFSDNGFEDLMQDEKATAGWIRLKRAAAFILCAGIGAALLFS